MPKEKFKVCPECGDEVLVDFARAVCNKCDVSYVVRETAKMPAKKSKPRKA